MKAIELMEEVKNILECEMAGIASATITKKGLVVRCEDSSMLLVSVSRLDDDDEEDEDEDEDDDPEDEFIGDDEDDEGDYEEDDDEVVQTSHRGKSK
jgi:hypothetical protein